MKLLDCRRLTGINLIWAHPGAVLDLEIQPEDDAEAYVATWQQHVEGMLKRVGWTAQRMAVHPVQGGLSLAISAPVDALYAAVELAEWAYDATQKTLAGEPQENVDEHASRLVQLIDAERNVELQTLASEAAMHRVMFLCDDDHVSVGLGRGSLTWPVRQIPSVIDWNTVHDIPIALVTGTNGKTTTVRLVNRILHTSGKHVGLSSTDWIGVDDQIIEQGDYSGPGGARTVLRQPTVDVAVLETARGGLLRRGLGVTRADVALITNVSEDHLGDFGSRNIQELLDLKWIVMRALDRNSIAVLNADDPLLVKRATDLGDVTLIWFSREVEHPVIQAHIKKGGAVVTLVDDAIVRFDGTRWHTLCAVNDIPVTLQGTALHNVANALAATSMSHALGAPDDAIVSGLTSMALNDNPGRCNLFRVKGFDVLVDFAHNPDAMSGLLNIARHHPAKRRLLCFGQAGDRTDELIRNLARGAWEIGLDHVIISRLDAHRRGRPPGEVATLLRQGLLEAGALEQQISVNDVETESLAQALAWGGEGDLVIFLALAESSSVLATLNTLQRPV